MTLVVDGRPRRGGRESFSGYCHFHLGSITAFSRQFLGWKILLENRWNDCFPHCYISWTMCYSLLDRLADFWGLNLLNHKRQIDAKHSEPEHEGKMIHSLGNTPPSKINDRRKVDSLNIDALNSFKELWNLHIFEPFSCWMLQKSFIFLETTSCFKPNQVISWPSPNTFNFNQTSPRS